MSTLYVLKACVGGIVNAQIDTVIFCKESKALGSCKIAVRSKDGLGHTGHKSLSYAESNLGHKPMVFLYVGKVLYNTVHILGSFYRLTAKVTGTLGLAEPVT